jgi:hypothetical protein
MAGLIEMAVTPNYSWPVPVATDLVKDGYAAIADLGDAIDATVFGLPSGGLTLLNTTTFTASTSIAIDNVFTATYENYKCVINVTNNTTSQQNLAFVLRTSAPADINGAFYNHQLSGALAGTPTTLGNPTGGAGVLQTSGDCLPVDNAGDSACSFDIFKPFTTDDTIFSGTYTADFGNNVYGGWVAAAYSAATSAAGIRFFPSAGNFTGEVRIYGYAD